VARKILIVVLSLRGEDLDLEKGRNTRDLTVGFKPSAGIVRFTFGYR